MKIKKHKKGFTLIELMVTLALLGILSTVGVVAYRGMMDASRRSARRSDAANLVSQLNLHNSIATSSVRYINGAGDSTGISFSQPGAAIICSIRPNTAVSVAQLRSAPHDVIVILSHTLDTGFKESNNPTQIAGDRLADVLSDISYNAGRWEITD